MTSHASRKTSAPGEVFEFYMDYTKRPLTLQQQIAKLKSRGLLIDDEQLAEQYLTNISYYRLRAYTYPFQDNCHEIPDFYSHAALCDKYVDCFWQDRRFRGQPFVH